MNLFQRGNVYFSGNPTPAAAARSESNSGACSDFPSTDKMDSKIFLGKYRVAAEEMETVGEIADNPLAYEAQDID